MNLKKLTYLAFPLAVIGVMQVAAIASVSYSETPARHDAKMEWFREAHFGMFIHWGLYSQLAGEWKNKTVGNDTAWIQKYLNIPTSQYSQLIKTWNPAKYDPRAWVKLMKAAGVGYIVITSKHHDGFCMWPTKCNDDWNICLTPGGQDVLKPLAEACREEGVRFCLYHSIPDWHHPDWPARLAFNDYAHGQPDLERYKTNYLFPEIKELLTNYAPVSLLWLDDGGMARPPLWNAKDGQELEDFIHSVDRNVILDDRSQAKPFHADYSSAGVMTHASHAGDYVTPERVVPPTGLPGIDWETCQTMQVSNTWGYNRLAGFRPFAELLRQLVDVSSKGGNMLLNVGPTGEGELLPQSVACLKKFASWMAVNSVSIHGATSSPFQRMTFDGRCTQKPGVLYLHVFSWPANGQLLVPITNKINRAYLLASPQTALDASTDSAHGARIAIPADAPDPIDSVVAVEFDGAPNIIPEPPNVALGKSVTVSSSWPGRSKLVKEHITDGIAETSWAARDGATDAWVQVDLGKVYEVGEAAFSDAPYGRTQAFDLEAQVNGQWKNVATGAAIGERLDISFEPVKAQLFRLTIRKASDTPTLAEFQLFGK